MGDMQPKCTSSGTSARSTANTLFSAPALDQHKKSLAIVQTETKNYKHGSGCASATRINRFGYPLDKEETPSMNGQCTTFVRTASERPRIVSRDWRRNESLNRTRERHDKFVNLNVVYGDDDVHNRDIQDELKDKNEDDDGSSEFSDSEQGASCSEIDSGESDCGDVDVEAMDWNDDGGNGREFKPHERT